MFKFLMLVLLMSCASSTINNKNYLISVTYLKNDKLIESAKILVKLNSKSEIVKERSKNYVSSISVFATQKEKGIYIDSYLKHISKKFGKVDLKQEVIVKPNIKAEFSLIDNEDEIKFFVTASEVVGSHSNKLSQNKVCMAKIYEYQSRHFKRLKRYNAKLIPSKLSKYCSKDAKFTIQLFGKKRFIAIGSFKSKILYIDQDKYMVIADK